ncbi:MAG: response regulator [Gracilimonas sp.]|uniref:response regulator n=1 Tax=Gracilimonas TaxID=649462 RepID=UPI001AFF2921|nr:response regulator [Gracilimonas sp.]MBO6586882.1 response regulator [Gracilimonas sp.]MBO6614630.1 response regulator [Gracilimonas sp.]
MGLNVLIVDDCQVMRMVIRRTVELCDFDINEIVEAENGRQALDLVREYEFGLIIADLNMPVMTGAEMLAHIKLDPATCRIPILTVSAESNGEKIEIVEELGTNFLHKPFTPEILRNKILKLLGKESITTEETDYLVNGGI